MLLATFNEAVDLYAIGAVILLTSALGIWGLVRLARRDEVVVKVLSILGTVVVGVGGIGIGALVILLGLAVNGCPPDAYECPF
jgi:hypothetical protein